MHGFSVSSILMKVARVEGESDDPDYLGHLGHFFGGSSGSHLAVTSTN